MSEEQQAAFGGSQSNKGLLTKFKQASLSIKILVVIGAVILVAAAIVVPIAISGGFGDGSDGSGGRVGEVKDGASGSGIGGGSDVTTKSTQNTQQILKELDDDILVFKNIINELNSESDVAPLVNVCKKIMAKGNYPFNDRFSNFLPEARNFLRNFIEGLIFEGTGNISNEKRAAIEEKIDSLISLSLVPEFFGSKGSDLVAPKGRLMKGIGGGDIGGGISSKSGETAKPT
jgi:hypothetical protein